MAIIATALVALSPCHRRRASSARSGRTASVQ
jgi:hypothetical protein